MAKLPAFQFYPGDWRKSVDVQSLSFHDRGVWFEMLLLMHESERRGVLMLNGRAMADEVIARVLGLDNQTFKQTLTNLLDFGVASREEETGAIISRRMIRDENLRKIRAEAGSKGGNPVLLIQNPTTPDKQIPTPSSSSSSSSSKREKKENSPIPEGFVYPSWLTPAALESYLKVRKLKKSPFVDSAAFLKWVQKMQKHHDEFRDVPDMLDQMITGNWIGPVEEKWKNRKPEWVDQTYADDPWGFNAKHANP